MAQQTIAILSPGDMGGGVGAALAGHGHDVITCVAGRSQATRARAKRLGFRLAADLDSLLAEADIVLSILPPEAAMGLARDVAAAMLRSAHAPPYADCNAVSPETARAIGALFEGTGARFIDGGIIGWAPRPDGPPTRFYVSGEAAGLMDVLDGKGISVRWAGPEIGRASAVKMCYASISKGTNALHTAAMMVADALGVGETVRAEIDESVPTVMDRMRGTIPRLALKPLHDLIAAHVLAAERLHGDDTPVPVLAKGKTDTARAWVYVRDDAPFGGPDPPAALFRYARDRSGDHPVEHLQTFAGILQADAYAGYRRLYAAGRSPGPVTEALCWSHGRRKFYELADIAANKRRGKRAPPISPLALEAVKRIDALFDIEREINGETAEHRHAVRRERSAPLVAELEDWMRTERAGLSRHAAVAKAMDYMLKRWGSFARFLDDGRICLTNNAAERALRGICLGRKSWLFAGSDRGGERAAVMYTLIGTAKLNDVDPQAWLADVLDRIADLPQTRLHELLPWSWKADRQQALAA